MNHYIYCPICGGLVVFANKPDKEGTINCPHGSHVVEYKPDEVKPVGKKKLEPFIKVPENKTSGANLNEESEA